MSGFCRNCGEKLQDDARFCPNCGKTVKNNNSGEKSYEDLIRSIVYIEEGNDFRLSKAKLIGVGLFVLVVFGNMFITFPAMLRRGFFLFFITVFACFVAGLIYYGICRGGGYLIRNYLIK